MGEGELVNTLVAANILKSSNASEWSPSPIGWERDGVRVSQISAVL
jgi:hypothetical protein